MKLRDVSDYNGYKSAATIEDLRNPPGNRLELLRG
jgi:hypothetical protein